MSADLPSLHCFVPSCVCLFVHYPFMHAFFIIHACMRSLVGSYRIICPSLHSFMQFAHMLIRHFSQRSRSVAAVVAVNGLAGAEAGAVHIPEVHAVAPDSGHQHTAVHPGRGCTLPHLGPVYPICQPGSTADGTSAALCFCICICCRCCC